MPQAQTQSNIQKALDRRIADNLVKSHFHSETIEFPENEDYDFFRCQNLVAILKVKRSVTHQRVQSLALFSLTTHSNLWNLEIQKDYLHVYCHLSEDGMVVMGDGSIVFEEKIVGVLEKLNWLWRELSGRHILGCWREVRSLTDPAAFSDPVKDYFGEYDQQGKCLTRYLLDNTQERKIFDSNLREEHRYAYNKNFWVRFSASNSHKVPAILEIVDRVIGKMSTFQFPLSRGEEKFSSPCMVHNQLIFGKSIRRSVQGYLTTTYYRSSLYIFDLVKGLIVEKFSTGSEEGLVTELVANEQYIAWMESNGFNNQIKYLDIFNKTIKKAVSIPYYVDSKVSLNIVQQVLSIIHVENSTQSSFWRRRTIDMTKEEVLQDVTYPYLGWGKCSLENGNMLLTGKDSTSYKMYAESFPIERNCEETLQL